MSWSWIPQRKKQKGRRGVGDENEDHPRTKTSPRKAVVRVGTDLSTKTWGFGFFKIQFLENLKNTCFSVFSLFFICFFFFVVFLFFFAFFFVYFVFFFVYAVFFFPSFFIFPSFLVFRRILFFTTFSSIFHFYMFLVFFFHFSSTFQCVTVSCLMFLSSLNFYCSSYESFSVFWCFFLGLGAGPSFFWVEVGPSQGRGWSFLLGVGVVQLCVVFYSQFKLESHNDNYFRGWKK